MSNRYQRYQKVVSRQADTDFSEDRWLKNFQEKLAVQPRSVDNNLFDQINSIMNNKSKYPSVDAAVEDMKERSGLTAYLNKINKLSEEEESVAKKVASNDNNSALDKKIDLTPIVVKKFPTIKNTLENYIRDTKGNLPVPAIIEKIKSIHNKDVSDAKDWDDENLIRLVSRLNLSAKTENPENYRNYENLGTRDVSNSSEIDSSNTDAFNALTPAK